MENGSNKPDAAAPTVTAKLTVPKAKHKVVSLAPGPARSREPSSITFPYRDLESGIAVARAMLEAGGVALTTEQLAGAMHLQPRSGNFVLKLATARIFGLITVSQGKYELTNLGFSIVDSDEKRQKQARAEAFLTVPLYRKTYDEFKARQLPPRPHGLEQAFVKFGVAPKQKDAARLAFDKSAHQAGFFSAGPDRLIEPIIGNLPPSERERPVEDEDTDDSQKTEPRRSGLPPFIQGLLDALPEPGTNWAVEGRAKWLQAAAHNFDLMYKGTGVINISAKNDQEPKV